MSRLLVFAISFAAACAYAPGSFVGRSGSFPGARAIVGCLDVAVTPVSGPTQRGPVVQYTVGNRCDEVAVVDFSAVRVCPASGVDLGPPMAPYDPKRELRPLRMEARTVITEQIEYRPAAPSAGPALCVDVARLNGPSRQDRWLCQEPLPAPTAVSSPDGTGGSS
jgi:hypothetical protein